jgi:hypothetical protein
MQHPDVWCGEQVVDGQLNDGSSFRDAPLGASPESILSVVIMDSVYPPITTIATDYAFRLRSKSFGG